MPGTKYSFHIAVEKYQDPTISDVPYAEADARELAKAFQLHDFAECNQQVLVNVQATKAATESKLRATIKRLNEDDTLVISFAGHGFSKVGENFLTCYDTQSADPVATSISLPTIYKDLRTSQCKRVILLLDACESGSLDMPSRSVFSHLTPSELEDFFNTAQFCICFASSETSQYSYSSSSLKHGIWTYHVIQALNGDAPQALEEGRYLTAATLQDYLRRAVPNTLSSTFSVPVHQTPRIYATQTSGNLLIADLKPLLDRRAAASVPGYQQVTRIMLTGTRACAVSNLSGFRPYHRVPEQVNGATEAFVAGIASREVEEEIDSVFDLLREKMNYSRQELSSHTDVGSGSIVTPDFDYSVEITLDPEDPSTALLLRKLSNIKKPQLIDSAEFEAVFARRFSDLELTLKNKINVTEWIDVLEQMTREGRLPDLQVYYPRNCSYCELRFSGADQTMTLTDWTCQISQRFVEPPAALFRKLLDAQQRLLSAPELRKLPL